MDSELQNNDIFESGENNPKEEIDLESNESIISDSTFNGKLSWVVDADLSKQNIIQDLSGTLNVEILSNEKVGEGMGAYVIFTIRTTTNIPVFKSNEMVVKRRFSDFLGLYQRLLSAHSTKGIIVPVPPQKQNIDSNKYKFVKDMAKENDFLEQRRMALLHFLQNLIRHPALRTDPALREFLEFDGVLPKATNTQTLSSTSASKLFKSFSDAIIKIAGPVDDPEEAQELNILDKQFSRLTQSFHSLSTNQAELSTSLAHCMTALDQISTIETENSLAVKIKKLSDVYDTLAKHEAVRAQAESVYLYEMSRNIVASIHAGKSVLDERTRSYRRWKDAEEALSQKRAQRMKLELSGKLDNEKSTLFQAQISLGSYFDALTE